MTFFRKDSQLEILGDRILEATWAQFPGLAHNQIALTWIIYDPPVPVNTGGALSAAEFWKHQVRGFSYRGVEPIYPAHVVKLFYLVAVYEWLDKNMIQTSRELERAIRDMIVQDSNDATSLVIDILTGTTSGPELPPGPQETWKSQRNIVNRYFQSLGWPEFESINVNQKTFCDGAYGRDRAFLGEMMENRNMLTTNATARLLHSIVGGVAVSSQATQTMMDLIKRTLNPDDLETDPNHSYTSFLGGGLPTDAQLWSCPSSLMPKASISSLCRAGSAFSDPAGHSQVRHDCAYIEIPDKQPYLLVVFTEGTQSQSSAILPFISGQVVDAMGTLHQSIEE